MNLVQIFLCWGLILLCAKAHPGISKRESEQKPMKLSWIPVVEPSELTKAQSLMIDIQPFDLEKPTQNIPRVSTRGRSNLQQQQQSERVNKQRPRGFSNQNNRQIPPEDEDERDEQDEKFSSVKPFIPGVIRHKPRRHNQPEEEEEENAQNTKTRPFKQTATRPRQMPKNRPQDDQDDDEFQPRSENTSRNRQPLPEDDEEQFQPRSHTPRKNRQPVDDDDDDDDFQPRSQTTHKNHQDEDVHFRIDKRHPFQGKEQNMPGEKENKRSKNVDRLRGNKFQSSGEEDDESGERDGGFTPVYLLDDPKQGGSSRHEDDDEERDEDRLVRAEPLEEFVGYYQVAKPKTQDEEDDEEDREENRDDGRVDDGRDNQQHKHRESRRKRPSKDVVLTSSKRDEEDQRDHFGFNHESDDESQRPARRETSDDGSQRPARRETSKRRNTRGRLETDSSDNFETKLDNEGFGIGIGYLSEI